MGRMDVEAHLVALRHPDLEGQDEILRWLEKCLGNLNAPCDLISKWGGIDETMEFCVESFWTCASQALALYL